ncbi:MAG: hypothetical protein ABS76_15150 [Pelagibacterium sp. SCN 64-44]|nr:MAG: hypothetical protein ABS76_15150 [Pelagibacterium sp. SCN 64-44]
MTRRDRQALVLLIAGFTFWSAAFVLLYALQALGCAYGWSQHRAILIAAFLLCLLPLAWLALRPLEKGEPASMLSTSALWANRAALAAGILVFVPVTFASTCL